MKKLKLTEDEIISLITNIISEQETTRPSHVLHKARSTHIIKLSYNEAPRRNYKL